MVKLGSCHISKLKWNDAKGHDMTKQESDIAKYLQWKYETIAGMTNQEFAELMKIMGKK